MLYAIGFFFTYFLACYATLFTTQYFHAWFGRKYVDLPTERIITKWISVKDRIPEEDVNVLVYFESYDEYRIGYIISGSKSIWACVFEREKNEVTHWMPLPDKPN